MSRFRVLQLVVLSGGFLVANAAGVRAQQQQAASGCVTCHSMLQGGLLKPVADFADDVHRQRGFSCVDCHGGDPAATERAKAKDPARGYRGMPKGAEVIAICARCHSDAEFMHRYAPRQRVDQASEYASSVHGKRLAAGDTGVATCVSCHRNHGIRLVSDAKSPVFPTNVATTCGSCHSSPDHMKRYMGANGTPLATNQRAEYEQSVHFAAMTKRNDLSAPTCNDCHGNHGAAPPGVGNVANVCGTCHAIFQAKFEQSTHKDVFDRGCVECHNNHAVLQTSDEMLGTGPKAICSSCHADKSEYGYMAAEKMRALIETLKGTLERDGALIADVRNAGLQVSAQELALGEARNRLTLARAEIHATNPALVEPIVGEGIKILAGVHRAGDQGLAELRFRRQGLFASLGAILLVVVALALKIKQMDRGTTH
ncbi:MAG: cytochrome c3 family protein [Acidobacteria bacterium]|nr:cytochrome c3 family protein [Acidobacteriota bacterium]